MESTDKGVNEDTEESIKVEVESEVEAMEVYLNWFQLAICTAGMCGNDVSRDEFICALAKFSMLRFLSEDAKLWQVYEFSANNHRAVEPCKQKNFNEA